MEAPATIRVNFHTFSKKFFFAGMKIKVLYGICIYLNHINNFNPNKESN